MEEIVKGLGTIENGPLDPVIETKVRAFATSVGVHAEHFTRFCEGARYGFNLAAALANARALAAGEDNGTVDTGKKKKAK